MRDSKTNENAKNNSVVNKQNTQDHSSSINTSQLNNTPIQLKSADNLSKQSPEHFFDSSAVKQKAAQDSELPGEVMSKMQNSFGRDFSNVEFLENSQAATDFGARAFTQGESVHFAPGQFKPDTTSGQRLIGHELAHVGQQRDGEVEPTVQAKTFGVRKKSDELEDDADQEANDVVAEPEVEPEEEIVEDIEDIAPEADIEEDTEGGDSEETITDIVTDIIEYIVNDVLSAESITDGVGSTLGMDEEIAGGNDVDAISGAVGNVFQITDAVTQELMADASIASAIDAAFESGPVSDEVNTDEDEEFDDTESVLGVNEAPTEDGGNVDFGFGDDIFDDNAFEAIDDLDEIVDETDDIDSDSEEEMGDVDEEEIADADSGFDAISAALDIGTGLVESMFSFDTFSGFVGDMFGMGEDEIEDASEEQEPIAEADGSIFNVLENVVGGLLNNESIGDGVGAQLGEGAVGEFSDSDSIAAAVGDVLGLDDAVVTEFLGFDEIMEAIGGSFEGGEEESAATEELEEGAEEETDGGDSIIDIASEALGIDPEMVGDLIEADSISGAVENALGIEEGIVDELIGAESVSDAVGTVLGTETANSAISEALGIDEETTAEILGAGSVEEAIGSALGVDEEILDELPDVEAIEGAIGDAAGIIEKVWSIFG